MTYKSFASHIEVPVPDLEKAKEIYATLFGWPDEMFQPFGPTYILVWDKDELSHPSFGLYHVDEMPPSTIMVTMETDNIEGFLKKVVELGGEVTREKYEVSPEIGHAADFKDPFGTKWGLHQSVSRS